ncbi:PAS domain S-box protein, partial [candidate division WOR-3 bacterium]|nr:PAS domain S-box protein [candidate division WOR-3 bacterium]MBD3363916.1 PAS domain S-box protein [candidate division WOR-3 bacterium]
AEPYKLGLPRDRNSLERNSTNSGTDPKTASEFTVEITTRNKQNLTLEVRVCSIPYGDGVAYLGNCIDITEKIRQREQLRLAKQEWERTFDSISDLVMVVNPAGEIEKVNKAVTDYAGIGHVELKGECYLDVFHQNGKPRDYFVQGFGKAEFFEVLDPETKKTFSISVSPLFDPKGKMLAMINVARDITQMKKISQALKESELQFRSLAENAQDIIFNVARDGSILYLNPAFGKILGWNPDEYIGTNLKDLLNTFITEESMKKELLDDFNGDAGEFTVPLFEFEAPDINGKKHTLEISASFISSQYVGIAREVTERKKMEAQLQQASKLASIGVLAAGLGHQVNNPLASLLATSSSLKETVNGNDKVPADFKEDIVNHLDNMEQQLDRTHNIVSGLLEFAKDKPEKVAPQEVNNIVHESLQFLSQHVSFKDVSLELELAEDMPYVMVDREATQQALINVVQNALEAIEGKGMLRIITNLYEEDIISIKVVNNGPPIPDEEKEKIFDLLYSTKTALKGTGLGLPVSAMLLDNCGGRLKLEDSKPGHTSFIIELPVKKGDNSDR